MKLTQLMLAAFAVCTMASCSKHDTLDKQPQNASSVSEPTFTLRAQGKENYWARCTMPNGEVGQKCTYGGWGCGNNKNTPRCAVRSTELLDILAAFTQEELNFYYSGQLTSAFVTEHRTIFQDLYELGIGDEPNELIAKLINEGL